MRVTVVPRTADPSAADPYPGRGAALDYPGWAPRCVVGAEAPGGLLLPPAQPTEAWLYAPRGVTLGDDVLVVADSGNHRVMIWHGIPRTDGTPADVVLGQPDPHTEGPAAGGRGPANGMHLPTGVLLDRGRLVVADAWHHRLLVWDRLPTSHATPPDQVIGQPDPESVEPNAGAEPDATSFYWPFGIALIDGYFYVADTGNRRVLVWHGGVPEPGRPADVVLGQPDAHAREENRGGPVAADSFRWPHDFAATGAGGVVIADAGNHRLLRWDTHPAGDCPADAVLGQPDFTTGTEFPYVPQQRRLRFPYAIASAGTDLAIADTANNRILLQGDHARSTELVPYLALAQPDLAANGENRWDQVGADTLCWPYGLDRRGDLLAVADSGNNRVVLWERS
ncbi:NHL repeat-containing protein [Tsukamurella soli]|uniref:NHL repeat-containing protein n=1 Tax=Tsukamurella soli TaxID=644556 RepID=A0ABP8K2E8_9ACTN